MAAASPDPGRKSRPQGVYPALSPAITDDVTSGGCSLLCALLAFSCLGGAGRLLLMQLFAFKLVYKWLFSTREGERSVPGRTVWLEDPFTNSIEVGPLLETPSQPLCPQVSIVLICLYGAVTQ